MKSAVFSSKISMITNVILILYNSSINNKLILRNLCFRHHIACFCSISPTKNNSKQLQHCLASLSNMMVIRSWMNQSFKLFGSVAMTHLLTVTRCHLLVVLISQLKYLFILKEFEISVFNVLFKLSKHYAFVTAGESTQCPSELH